MFLSSLWVLFALLLFEISAANVLPGESIKPHILNGDEASSGQFPWQVALTFYGDSSKWYCSGVLVKEDWVLTAGHCGSFNFVNAIAYAGSVNDRYGGVQSTGYNFVIPSGYDEHTLSNDIGLFQLEEPFEINDNVKPIDLASGPLCSDVNITVSGWGATNENGDAGPSSSLLYTNLTTINNFECKNTYGADTISDEMVCAVSRGDVTHATCFGDNGGPAIVYEDGNPALVGIASFISDRGCESGDPSGFTRIWEFREWIISTADL